MQKNKRGEKMNLGTIVYDNEIYNLDYMTEVEIKELIDIVEEKKKKCVYELKNIRHDAKDL